MPIVLPDKKPDDPGEAAWLMTRVIVFLAANYALILMSVVTAVTLGGSTFIVTNNRLISAVCGISIYFACIGGKSWVVEGMARLLFSFKDEKTMDDVLDGKK